MSREECTNPEPFQIPEETEFLAVDEGVVLSVGNQEMPVPRGSVFTVVDVDKEEQVAMVKRGKRDAPYPVEFAVSFSDIKDLLMLEMIRVRESED